MNCPSIQGLKLSVESRRGIDEIKRTSDIGRYLTAITSMGHLATIFTTGRPLEMSYNIYNTDFAAFAGGLVAVPKIQRHKIETIAGSQWLRASTHQERTFWRAVYEGCKLAN